MSIRTVLFIIVIVLTLRAKNVQTTYYYNYIEEGKYTLDDIERDVLPEIGTDAAGVSYSPHPDIPHEPGDSTDEPDYVYFPSPDDDGTYIKVIMSEVPVMTFHITGPNIQPASLVMSIQGFNFQPYMVKPKDVRFYLFTKKNPESGIEIFHDINNTPAIKDVWNLEGGVKILCHGFQSSSKKPFPQLMKNSYMKLDEDFNVILVDWNKIAGNIVYPEVAKETYGVGEQVADLVGRLIKDKLTNQGQIHFIGHSLGAHVGGSMGYVLQQRKYGKVSRISGLDPAGPYFCDDEIGKLQKTDAEFVDVIHTDDSDFCKGWWKFLVNRAKGKFGSDAIVGHANFFPNGGRMQPGCGTGLTDTCSHSRAYYYMEESFNSTLKYTFNGCGCETYKDYLSGNCECSDSNLALMGEYTPIKTKGKYYLKTGHKYPYAKFG